MIKYCISENSIFYVDYFVNGHFGESRGFFKNFEEESKDSVLTRACQYFDIVYKKCQRNEYINVFEIHLKDKENKTYQNLYVNKGGN